MKNIEVGTKSENDFLDFLASKGYWCYRFPVTVVGQPCDVIACKENKIFLIDVKHCEKDRFEIRRIEPNQKTCFSLASSKGIKNIGFAIYFESDKMFRWLPFEKVKDIKTSIKKEEMELIYESRNWQ